MGILSVDLNNINLNDANFDDNDPETIVHVRILAWCNQLKQHKAFKDISKKLMSIAWHQQDDGIGACEKMRKKNRTNFY